MVPPRRLAAIMFTDIAGFTRSTHADEAAALARLAEHERRVRPILRRHAGREIKTIGDSFLVEFASALDACRCAIDVQTHGATEGIRVRIGIHLGDVVHRGGDVFGDAVNIASRVERLAEPGGICVTQQVVDQVANKLGVPLVRRSGAELRGVVTPIGVYSIALARPGAPAPASGGVPARRRVAVLPLANLSVDPDLEYLADGFTEELILRLSKVPDLHVLARTTIMRFKGTAKSPAEIARELGVDAMLEGSVRAQDGRLRITTTLVDPHREEPLWSEGYDRQLRDVLDVQREIAERTAESLSSQLSRDVEEAVAAPPTRDPDAYTAYLRGRYFWNRRSEESLRRAIDAYGAALARDPRMPLAYAGIADAFAARALLEFDRPAVAFPRAQEAAERALALDPACAEALTSLGVVKFQFDRDWAGSEAAFRRAIALQPSYAPAHHQFADLLKALGRFDEALAEIETARELDPLSLAINTGVGHVLYLARRYDAAIEQYRRTLELDPSFVLAHLWFGRPYLEKGMFREAIAEIEQAVRMSGESTISLAVLAHAFAAAGERVRAQELLERLQARSRTTYVPSYWIALVYAGLGDRTQAFRWLDRAFAERSSWLTWVRVEPRFDPLRGDRRFARLLTAMHLVPPTPDGPASPKGRGPRAAASRPGGRRSRVRARPRRRNLGSRRARRAPVRHAPARSPPRKGSPRRRAPPK